MQGELRTGLIAGQKARAVRKPQFPMHSLGSLGNIPISVFFHLIVPLHKIQGDSLRIAQYALGWQGPLAQQDRATAS